MQVKTLAGKAKEGKLLPHEYQGGTFSVSNLGTRHAMPCTLHLTPYTLHPTLYTLHPTI